MKTVSFLLFTFSLFCVWGQPITFETAAPASRVIEEANRYVLGGTANDDLCFVISDKDGNLGTVKTYGGAGYDFLIDMIALQDGQSYLLGGSTFSDTEDSIFGDKNFFYLVKTDLQGNKIWDKIIVDSVEGECYDILQDKEGNIYAYGQYKDYETDAHFVIYKMDVNGNIIWKKQYANEWDFGIPGNIVELADGNLLLTGHVRDSVGLQLGRYYYMAKINPDGDTLWTKKWDNPYIPVEAGQLIHDIKKTPHNTFILVGVGLLAELDSIGNTIWMNYDAGYPKKTSVYPISDGFVTIEEGQFVRKYDYQGNLILSKTFPSFTNWNDIIQTSDGGFALVGMLKFAKTDCVFNIQNPINCVTNNEILLENQVNVYPNPTQDYIEIHANNFQIESVKLYDLFGKCLFQSSETGKDIRLNCKNYPTGLYLLRVGNSAKYSEQIIQIMR